MTQKIFFNNANLILFVKKKSRLSVIFKTFMSRSETLYYLLFMLKLPI